MTWPKSNISRPWSPIGLDLIMATFCLGSYEIQAGASFITFWTPPSSTGAKSLEFLLPSLIPMTSPSDNLYEGTRTLRPFTVMWPWDTICLDAWCVGANPTLQTALSRRDSRFDNNSLAGEEPF